MRDNLCGDSALEMHGGHGCTTLTAIDKVDDLVICHACALVGTQGSLLLHTPVVDILRVLGVDEHKGIEHALMAALALHNHLECRCDMELYHNRRSTTPPIVTQYVLRDGLTWSLHRSLSIFH